MPPPGHTATTEPRVEQISAVSETDLTTRTKQMRFLVAELGVTRRQAHALIRAHECDQERPVVTAGKSYSASFLRWLMKAPVPRHHPVAKWQIGQGQWRTS